MRNNFLFFIATLLIVSCQSIPKADKVIVVGQQPVSNSSQSLNYEVDTSLSKVIWTGTKPVGRHIGTFQLAHGSLNIVSGRITGGSFMINIASLTDLDLQGNAKKKLEAHLKSADFFEVEKYPTAVFAITQVTPFDSTVIESQLQGPSHLISGNLTLKGVTKNVTFPASIVVTGNALEAKANFNIDRTDWGLSYGSDKSIQDRFIHPMVNIELKIKANSRL